MSCCGIIGMQGGIAWDFCCCRCHHCRQSPDGAGINETGGIGGGGGAAIVASFAPLLSDGELSYSGSNIIVVVVPSPQILLPGAGAIVKSHLAAINGHQRRCSSPTTMITLTTVNASTALSSSNALALLDSLKEAIEDEDAAVVAVKSPPPPPRGGGGGDGRGRAG